MVVIGGCFLVRDGGRDLFPKLAGQ